jgi:hemerythrin-like metal-binding protein
VPVYEWKPTYSVNVKRCDDDHKKLFALICDLRSAMKSGRGAQATDTIVAELESASVVHFKAEEALMERTKYPCLESHRMEHRTFIDTLAQFRREGISAQPYEVLNFMSNWLVNHIKRTDQQYSAHLNANGVR